MNRAEHTPLIIVDRLPDLIPVDRSEAEWLLTLLSKEELSYIFNDPVIGHAEG